MTLCQAIRKHLVSMYDEIPEDVTPFDDGRRAAVEELMRVVETVSAFHDGITKPKEAA